MMCGVMFRSSAHLILETLPMSFTSLERAVKAYQQHMPATAGQPLNLASLPVGECCHTDFIYLGIPCFILYFSCNISDECWCAAAVDNYIDTYMKIVDSVMVH